ncbi:diguanylate cyclase [Leptolyngbya sp. FACHB-541]|uniref:diguanylate cyclase domain-containing protein n=1 Tax=Leptolyngbya sp. FACHB-541 TaxID=2692810 RepID=UPI00322085DE
MVGDAIGNLLIVDDQPDNLRVLSSILDQQGYKVRKALNGAIALQSAQIHPPDLILLDIMMPGMNGYEVCTALKASPETREVPVVFLSGVDSAADKVRAFAVGGSDYITKPFQAEEVLARVHQQLMLQWQTQRLQREIQERKQAQSETQLLLTIIQAVDEATNFEAALDAVLCEVRRAIAWDYSEAWTSDLDDTAFHLSRVDYDAEDVRLQQFHEMSRDLSFDQNVSLLKTIWTARQPEWIADISQSTSMFLRSPVAQLAGLTSAFAVPIVLEEQVLAVLLFFKRSHSEFEINLVNLVSAIALQLGGFMQRKQAEEALRRTNLELKRLVNSDGLTQIANRRCFDQVLQQEWQRLRREQLPLSLILCDVDFFKRYNDHYGHLNGDDCLKRVAQAIGQSIKRPADLAARYGGEEFAVILPNTDSKGAIYVAQCIQNAMADLQIPHKSSQVSEFVTVSIGIASAIPHSHHDGLESLITTADKALYAAKEKGRNTYCY